MLRPFQGIAPRIGSLVLVADGCFSRVTFRVLYKHLKVSDPLNRSQSSILLLFVKMSAPPFEPIVANSGFETGLLAPWIPSDPAAATIANGTQAYTGDYYL